MIPPGEETISLSGDEYFAQAVLVRNVEHVVETRPPQVRVNEKNGHVSIGRARAPRWRRQLCFPRLDRRSSLGGS